MKYDFSKGSTYTRKDVYRIIGIPTTTKGSNWHTGYSRLESDYFVFCNVGVPGRTGHDYHNQWVGNRLKWYAKIGSTIGQNTIKALIDGEHDVYVFYRLADKDPFTFCGLGRATDVQDTSPVELMWRFE